MGVDIYELLEGRIPAKTDASKEEGTKYDRGKTRLDLLSMEALEEVGKVYTYGTKKYDAHNWRKGLKFSRIIAAVLRHFFAFIRGEDRDKESGLLHLAHAAWGILTLISFFVQYDEYGQFDDRYVATPKSEEEAV